MAIDYGLKRCGLAATDDFRIIASALTALETKDLMNFMIDYLSKNQVDIIVVGDPKGLDGKPTDGSAGATGFANALQSRFPRVKVAGHNEIFTSKMASAAIAQSGLNRKKRQDKFLTDKVSAVIILQSYMEWLRFHPE